MENKSEKERVEEIHIPKLTEKQKEEPKLIIEDWTGQYHFSYGSLVLYLP